MLKYSQTHFCSSFLGLIFFSFVIVLQFLKINQINIQLKKDVIHEIGEQFSKQSNELKTVKTNLEGEIDVLKNKFDTVLEENSKLKETKPELETVKTYLEHEIDELETKLETVMKENRKAKETKYELETVKTHVESEINELKSKLETIVKENTKAKEVIKNENKNKVDNIIKEISEEWIDSLRCVRLREKVFSQYEEDKVLEKVFDKIGTTDKIYVEFGVEDCTECNTRHFRENLGWDVNNSLLMDGGYSNSSINLKQELFWPSNIISLFKKYSVKKEFDLLSVDTDSYDWFMLETILVASYRPRVIIIEYNPDFNITESKSIMPPEKGTEGERWDKTQYQGMSLQALLYLMKRFLYSTIWCNRTNCLAIRNDIVGGPRGRTAEQLYRGHGWGHLCDPHNRVMAIINEDGTYGGEDDGGLGSPLIRCGKEKDDDDEFDVFAKYPNGIGRKYPYKEEVDEAC